MNTAIEEFVETASEYCSLIERHDQETIDRLVRRLSQLLPLLYYRAVMLPETKLKDDSSLEREISPEQWNELFSSLIQYFGPHDAYWAVHCVNLVDDNAPESTIGSLSDDLADIWRDLKNGLLHWNDASKDQKYEIVWKWRFNFHGHWSNHVIDAMRVVNHLCQDMEIDD